MTENSRRTFLRGAFQSAARAAIRAKEEYEAPAIEAVAPPLLSDAEVERYSRQLVLPEWTEHAQTLLRDASVLVVGTGALGSPVAAYLAGAGVGRIGLVDSDVVEISNLHRQPLHFTPDLGVPKVESAAAKLRFLNPDVLIEPYQVRLDAENAAGLVEGQDLVIDCSDSFATRYAVNKACCEARVDLIEGGAVGWIGLVMTIIPFATACYRCAFPVEPGDSRSCAEAGILGPVAGTLGSLQALEAIKLLSGAQPPTLDAFLSVDLASMEFTRVSVHRRADCEDCGEG
ncbi:HesA/MoeB/ThiF family protein [Solirubrobacter phytolaccae]|uniref:HesA/MoeB/ThiF family protein n=1 Tax=Solirubrobacter phytolaccae TaxID=1404360 RepID=A0A9X3N7H6_9ACTN|nr:HesA/MoeB/ThiF family protein [Solirubrobacter phytolaccae]MDA0180916.1 HesA/MoeB/ThiF family protein [Solirubrobacter phytolaccae]